MKDRDSSLMAGMNKGYDKSKQVILWDSSHNNPVVAERIGRLELESIVKDDAILKKRYN
jgi:hypothetical protein